MGHPNLLMDRSAGSVALDVEPGFLWLHSVGVEAPHGTVCLRVIARFAKWNVQEIACSGRKQTEGGYRECRKNAVNHR
jgi:hypothetical protein